MKNLFTTYKDWSRRKILVIHMSTPHMDVEKELQVCGIDFESWKYREINLESAILSESHRYCGIIISGSIFPQDIMPPLPDSIFRTDMPVLGLCYGHEVIGINLGSELVECNGGIGEYSEVEIQIFDSTLFSGLDLNQNYSSFMAHHLMLRNVPPKTKLIAKTALTPIAGFESNDGMFFGLQFHPEKSWMGQIVFKNFYRHCVNRLK